MLIKIVLYNGKEIVINKAHCIKVMDANISECADRYQLTQLEILDLTRKILDR